MQGGTHGAQVAVSGTVQQDLGLLGLMAVEDACQEPVQLSVAKHLLHGASGGGFGVQVEQGLGGVIESQEPSGGVDHKHRLDHAREHRLELVALLGHGADTVVELGRHLVHGQGQVGGLRGAGHDQAVAQVSGGEPDCAGLHLLQRQVDSVGEQKRQPAGQECDDQPPHRQAPVDPAQGLGDRAQGSGGADHGHQRSPPVHGYCQVHHVLVQGGGVARRGAEGPRQGGLDLRTISVVVHGGGIFERVPHDPARGQHDRESGGGPAAQIAAPGLGFRRRVEPLGPGQQSRHEVGVSPEIPGCLAPQGGTHLPGGVHRNRHQRQQQDEEKRGIQAP